MVFCGHRLWPSLPSPTYTFSLTISYITSRGFPFGETTETQHIKKKKN